MPRFFAPKEKVTGNSIHIDGREARHMLDVMRLGEEDKVVVFDGTGKEYTGFIKSVSPGRRFGGRGNSKSLVVEIISTKIPKSDTAPEITLVQAIPKKNKMDYVIEKATELGVHCIFPVMSERTVIRLDEEKALDRLRRWKKIAVETAKQCGRTSVPEIKKPEKFYNVIRNAEGFDLILFACISKDTVPLKEAIKDFESGKITVFIGPEGDFTPEEIGMSRDTNSRLVSLGPRVLKSDTAGLYVISVLTHEFSR